MKDLIVIIGIITILIEGYRLLRGEWIRWILGRGKETKRERKPVVLKPKSERKGKQQAQRYRRQIPAKAAGLATKRWMVKELMR